MTSPNPIDTALDHATATLRKARAQNFELYLEQKSSTKIDSKDLKVETLSQAQDTGLSIRVIQDQKLGFSFTTSLEPRAIERAVQSAIDVAQFMPVDPFLGFESFSQNTYPALSSDYDSAGLAVGLSEKIEMTRHLEDNCRKSDRRITGIRSANFAQSEYTVRLVDSEGRHLKHQMTLFSTSITCKAEDQGGSQMGGDFDFTHFLKNLRMDSVAQTAAKHATELLGAKNAPTMKCPAIFRNDVVSELLDFISSSFAADQIDKGRSMLAGKLGEQLFSEKVHLVDDGLMPGGYGSSPFDGEGAATTRTTLVENGVIQSFLYDGYYGRKFGTRSTGSSQRGIKSPPSIGHNNLYLQAGKTSLRDLTGMIDRGILITELMGIHTANPVTGDFSLGASGILIENGVLTQPVRGFAVAGNILDVFKKITDIGSDLRFFGNTGAPSVRVGEISVGGEN